MDNRKDGKNYIRVIADMRPDLQIMPLKVIVDDKEYKVDSVIDIKRMVVPTLGERCFAYYCKFKTKLRILYLDAEFKWFTI